VAFSSRGAQRAAAIQLDRFVAVLLAMTDFRRRLY
jgi:hypothetical protein